MRILTCLAVFIGLSTNLLAQKVLSPGNNVLGIALSQAKEGDVLYLKNGTYKKISESYPLVVPKKNITIIGESRDGVIITGDYYSDKVLGRSATLEPTFLVEYDGFYAENVTFENTATQAQAIAVRADGDSIIFNGCRMLGYQDTHRANKRRQYMVNCETWGDVDFIYGDAACMYDYSLIVSRNRNGGYITAPEDSKIFTDDFRHGIVIKNSDLKAEDGLTKTCYLGRPWKTNSSSVFINCKVGSHISPAGWQPWDGKETATYMAEYKSKDAEGNLLDVSQRVPWSTQMSDADTLKYTIEFFFKGWDPRVKLSVAQLAPPTVFIVNDSLKWSAVSGARGYLLFRNDTLVDFTAKTFYSVKSRPNATYTLKTANRNGRLGVMSQPATEPVPTSVEERMLKHDIYVSNRMLYVPDNEVVSVYNMSGGRMLFAVKQRQIAMHNLPHGVYVVRVKLDKKGTHTSQKVVVY